jgi:hypothetical protein
MNPDFVDLLRAFIARDVCFLIVGAYALAVHGRPRATGDLHVWVEATDENATRVIRALEDFGAPLTGVSDYLGREAFIRNKRVTGGTKDLADIEGIEGEA